MKNLLTIAMITLAAFAAKADFYLYWTVDVTDTQWAGTAAYAGLFSGETGVDSIAIGDKSDALITGSYADYWVKLYDSALNEIAVSSSRVTFNELKGMSASPIWDSTTTTVGASGSPYSFNSFVIPEPTSGLMLLLGLGALALKRRI